MEVTVEVAAVGAEVGLGDDHLLEVMIVAAVALLQEWGKEEDQWFVATVSIAVS